MTKPLADHVYDPLKANSQEIDPPYYSEVRFSDYFGDGSQEFPQANGQNLLKGKIKENYGKGFMFGGTH